VDNKIPVVIIIKINHENDNKNNKISETITTNIPTKQNRVIHCNTI